MATHFRHHGTDDKNYTPPQAKISHGSHWLRTLQEGTGFHVTDPRDRVYAILGIIASPSTRFWVAPPKHGTVMTNGTTPKEFPIDYGRSISEVYQDVVKHLVNVERNLDSLCIFQNHRRHNSDIPSWAMDWRNDSARAFIESSQDLAEMEQVLGRPPLQDLNRSSVLHVSGYQVSRIFSLHTHSLDSLNRTVRSCLLWTFGQKAYKAETDLLRCVDYYVTFNRDIGQHDLSEATGSIKFLVPRDSMLDDEIMCARGAKTPLVLRRVGSGRHRFIGPVMMIAITAVATDPRHSDALLDASKSHLLRIGKLSDYWTMYPDWRANAKRFQDYILV